MFRCLTCAIAITVGSSSIAQPLEVLSLQSMDIPKQALKQMTNAFATSTPGTEPNITTMEHEALKASVQQHLRSGKYDILTWHAGNRARVLAERGLLDPIDDIIPNVSEFSEGVRASVTFNGKLYCVPHAYYHWSLYYNRKLFHDLQITEPPTTWGQLLSIAKKFKTKGITPITIGTKEPWTAGGWFDFIGMHSYGYDFHMKLLRGEAKYTDKQVSKALNAWVDLVQAGAFAKDHRKLSWKDAAKDLVSGKAAMMLMGNFWLGEMKVSTGTDSPVGPMRFPVIDGSRPLVGVAPTDVLCLAANAPNKALAGKFLAYAAKAEVQENNAKFLHLLPPNRKAAVDAKDIFSMFGKAYLDATAGITQFYDREADPEVARRGMDMMVNLIDSPEILNLELEKVEKVRKRVHRE